MKWFKAFFTANEKSGYDPVKARNNCDICPILEDTIMFPKARKSETPFYFIVRVK